MTIKLLAEDEFGKKFLVDPDSLSGTPNVVLSDTPCDASVYIGSAVIMSSGTAVNGIATALTTSNIIGIVEAKPTATTCDIRVSGVTIGDIFSGLDESKEYYLSDSVAGGLTNVAPNTSGSVRLRIGQPFDGSNLLVMKGERTVRL